MQYKRLDPNRGLSDHLYDLKAQLRANDTAPTGDVGLSGQIVATDPETGVETIIGRLPDGSTGIQQWVNDVTPPGQPTTPSAEPTLNGVTLTWDGLILGGTAQPADYDRTEIEYSENGTLWAKGGTFTKANSYTVPGLTVGTSYSFRLVSYDKNNNASTPSGTVTATPVAIIDNADIDSALQELRNKDTELTTGVSNASKAASDAAGDALEAFNKAKSIPTTFYTATRPPVDAERPFVVGDTWYDTDDNNKVYVWDGQDFILSIDPRIEQNNAALIDLTEEGGILDSMQNDIDQKITTYYGPAPATKEIGDLWLDATDPNNQILKRWDGNTWVVFDNPRVQEAYNAANTAQTTADKKIQTFTGTSAPANSDINDLGVGDLWIDTTAGSGKIYRWSGTATGWQEVVDNGEAAVNTALANLGLDQEFVDSVATLEDRAITTFFGTDTPVDPQEGDLWLTGVAGTPMKRRNSVGAWVDFEDPNVKAAYGIAQGAATEADKKIRTFAQTTAPTGLIATDLGDLWIDTDDGQIYRWQLISGTTYGWVKVNDNGISAADQALTDLGLNAQWKQDIEAQADRAIATFYGTASPTGMQAGDIWLSGVAGTPMKRWDGDSWETFEDPNVAAAYGRAGEALTAADSKIITYAQTTAPTGLTSPSNDGDLWINTSTGVDKGKISRFANNAWTLVTDNGVAAANKALADLGLNQDWVDGIEAQADRAIDTFFGTAAPTGMQTGDLWLTGVAGEPMKRWDGDSWETFEDPNIQNAYQNAIDAQNAAAKALESAKSTINPLTSANGITIGSGTSLTLVDSTTAMGGKALQKSGGTHSYFYDKSLITAIDPNVLYRLTVRVRITTPATSGGGLLYVGAYGYSDADGNILVNSTGANSTSSQHWIVNAKSVTADGTWYDFTGYMKGISSGDSTGSGTIDNPKTFHANAKYFSAGGILDYNSGNGTWEVSHISVDAIDPIGHQALIDAGSANELAKTKIRTFAQPTAPTGMNNTDNTGDLWIDTDNGKVSRWANNQWNLVVDNGDAAAQSALDALGLNQSFVDKVENLEDKAITTFYGPDTPASPKEGDLWLKGTGIDPMQRWTNGAWVKFENPAVEAAYNTAGDAEALADKKVTTYAQNDPPVGTVDLPLSTGDLWIDTNDTNKLYRFVEGTGAGTGWIAVRDTGIGAAQDTANTALKAAAFSGNPSFDDWTSTAPVGYTSFTTNPTKETTTVRIPKNGARWSVTTTSQQAGLQFAAGTVAGHLPNLEYYTVELEFYLVSGTLGGAGVILDWNGTSMLNNRATLNLATEFPNGVNTGKWYRVTKTLRRPTNISGTWSSMGGYLMANWSTFGGAVKNIIFDWFNIRPATAEEITSYGVPGRLQTIDGAIAEKGKVIIQSATPAASDRLPQNLWIDTTPIGDPPAPGNIPKRWNATTSTWDAVTEKAVVDAAALAAKANEDANTALGNAGNAMTAAGERTRIVHLNTTPPTPPSGWKEGDVWYKHATADIKSDITDWYRWTNNAWVVQAMDDHFGTFIPKLNIGIGTYGFLKGTQLEAKSISVEKIILSSMDNVIADGEFRGSPSQWSMPSGVSIVQGAGRTGGPVLRMGGVNAIITSNNGQSPIPVEGGNAYRSVLYVKPNTNLVTGSVRLSATVRLADGVYQTPTITTITGTPLSANVWTPVTGLWTAPTNAVSVQFSLIFLAPSTSPASVDIDSVTVTRAADAKLVVDGSIDGKTITGALIQSMASTYRGIKLSANQLIAYDSSGTAAGETFRIDGNTGAVTMKGNITSGSTITGATIQTSSGIEKIKLDASSLRAWNSSGEEYFSILNGEVTLTGVTNTTGFTAASYGLRPILTSVGNVVVHNPSSNVVNNLPGMQWKLLDDGAAMTSFPAVVSYSGMDLVLSGGVAPDGSYANVEMWSDYGDVHINASDGVSIQAGLGLIHMFGNVQFGGYIDQTNIQANLHVDLAPNYALIAPIFATAAVGSPSLIMRNYDAGGVQRPGIWFSRDGGAGGDEASIFVSSADDLVIGPPTGKETWFTGRTRLGYASGYNVIFASGFPGFYLRNDGSTGVEKSGDAAFWSPLGSNVTYVRSGTSSSGSRGPFRIDSGTDLEHYDPPTSTFAANLGISSSPKDRIYKLTSAPKYKVNREMIDLSTSWNILNVTPSMWYDRAQIENVLGEDVLDLTDPDHPQIDPTLLAGLDLKTIPGVSAKDVEAAGLKQFVTYDENGEVEGVSYDRMWILLIPIIRELLQRMTAIDKKPITPVGPLKPIVNPRLNKKK